MSAEIDVRTYLPEDEPQQETFSENLVNNIQEEAPKEAAESPQDDKEQNFKAFREEIKQKISEVEQLKTQREQDRREFQLQMELIKANVERQQEPVKPRKMFDGMADDDVLNVAEVRKELESREVNYQARIEELEFQQTHPDYVDVLNNYLSPLIKEHPSLAERISRDSHPAAFAYMLGSIAKAKHDSPSPTPAPPPSKAEVAQRIVENARKPGTLAQAGGQSVLSKADYYATMSDQEFLKLAASNLEGI